MPPPGKDAGADHRPSCLSVVAITAQRAPAPDGTCPFLLSVVAPSKSFSVVVLPSDTVQYVNDVIWAQEGIPPGLSGHSPPLSLSDNVGPQDDQRLELRGHSLDHGATLSQSGIDESSNVTLAVLADASQLPMRPILPAWTARPSSPGKFTTRGRRSPLSIFQKQTEAEKQGLQPRALATALRDWDGVIPDGPKGLKLKKDGQVTIGRVVNGDWYQGYSLPDEVGYLPRNFMKVTDVLESTIIPELGADAPAPRTPPLPLPPSPFPPSRARAAYDRTSAQTRVSAVFAPSLSLAPPFLLTITLTLVAAPGARVAHATFRAAFPDGVITALAPVDRATSATGVQHAEAAGHDVELSVGAGAALPAQVSVAVKGNTNHSEEYARHTWGRVQGSGVGFREALWVFEEDQGKGGRHGIPVERSTETLTLDLSVRPAVCEYEVEATVVEGDGEAPGWFNSKTHKSGIQRVLLG